LQLIRLFRTRRVSASIETVLSFVHFSRHSVNGPKMRADVAQDFAALPANTFPETRVSSERIQLGLSHKLPLRFVSPVVRIHGDCAELFWIRFVLFPTLFFQRECAWRLLKFTARGFAARPKHEELRDLKQFRAVPVSGEIFTVEPKAERSFCAAYGVKKLLSRFVELLGAQPGVEGFGERWHFLFPF
jgi:hypothetical protein